MIMSWSYSRLVIFEQCKYRAKLAYILKVPEPQRPLPAGKTEHAVDRGTRLHEALELYIRANPKVELLPELHAMKEEAARIADLYAQNKVILEGEWAVNDKWEPVAWSSHDAWGRMKLDVFIQHSNTEAEIIDWKTGRKFGNEVKHTEQGQLYQLGCFLRFPELETVNVRFIYVDHPSEQPLAHSYTRNVGLQYQTKFEKRAQAMITCSDFKPNPNKFSCRWCPYNGNTCTFGVTP